MATREDVAGLEVQVARLEKSVTSLEKRQADLSSQLDAVKTPVMSLNSNLADTQSLLANFAPRFEEIRSLLEGLKKDLSVKTADLSGRIAELAGQMNALGENLQAGIAQLKKNQPTASAPKIKNGKDAKNGSKPAAASKENRSAEEETGSSQSPLAVFQAAYKDFQAERWSLAQEGFAQYLKEEPEGSLADKSHYYSAVAARFMKNNMQALDHLEKILERFSKSPLTKAAMLEKAKIFTAEKRHAEAEGMLEYLAVSFPKSQEAEEARELLKKLPK